MQLTLSTTPFSKPSVTPRAAPNAARPRDATAMSQLDQIAAQNLQPSRQGLGGGAMLLALVGGLVIVGSASMWSAGADEPRKAATVVAEALQAPAAEVAVIQAPVAAAPQAATAATVAEPTAPATPVPALAAAAAAEPMATADDTARKARAAKAADARRKATQLAQERALAEETQRLQLAQQREAERAQQQLAEQARQRAAAEQARVASVQLATNTHRGVGDICSGAGNFISQQFCRSRECGKSEHHGDATCVRQRENELAQQRASNER